MKLNELKKLLMDYENQLSAELKKEMNEKLRQSVEAYPFNEYEFRLTYLQENKIITFSEYERIRQKYISTNKYLELYGLAPRVFGQIWGESNIRELDIRFTKPANYSTVIIRVNTIFGLKGKRSK